MEKQLLEIEKKLVALGVTTVNIKDDVAIIMTEQLKLIKAVSGLKIKSGIWGLIGGALPSSVILIFLLFKLLM